MKVGGKREGKEGGWGEERREGRKEEGGMVRDGREIGERE